MTALDNVCDVCQRKVDWVGVHSSSFAAMSFASCVECLRRYAEMEGNLHYIYDYVSTKGEGLSEWVQHISTYKDGKYMTWAEWVAWRQDPIRCDELDKQAELDLEAVISIADAYGELDEDDQHS
nr:Unknown Function [uncultured bacterium]